MSGIHFDHPQTAPLDLVLLLARQNSKTERIRRRRRASSSAEERIHLGRGIEFLDEFWRLTAQNTPFL